MPYVTCPRCGISAYSAAPWSYRAECPNCGAALDLASDERAAPGPARAASGTPIPAVIREASSTPRDRAA